jgi:glycosyltransferase involved in cell wall biosynthesis
MTVASGETVHLWVPDLQAAGGIQHFSRALVRALAELAPECRLKIFSKNDRSTGNATGGFILENSLPVQNYGHYPARLRTAAYVLGGWMAAAKERPRWILGTHPHFSKALQLIKSTLGIPYVPVVHGVETWGHVHGPLRSGLLKADLIIAVSEFTRRHLVQECGFPQDKVVVVPNTFDESLFSPGPKPSRLIERHHLAPDQPVLLTVGRLSSTERYKGHEQVIRALPAICEKQPNARYVIVGDGDDAPRLQALSREVNMEKQVIFAGFVPREDLPDYYHLADIFVMPSTGEGFGIVFLEALASGRPVIAANADASPEALDGGRLGWLVDPGRPDQIAEGALAILGGKARPELNDSAWLRSEVVRLFGFNAFKQHLRRALDSLPAAAATLKSCAA